MAIVNAVHPQRIGYAVQSARTPYSIVVGHPATPFAVPIHPLAQAVKSGVIVKQSLMPAPSVYGTVAISTVLPPPVPPAVGAHFAGIYRPIFYFRGFKEYPEVYVTTSTQIEFESMVTEIDDGSMISYAG